MTKSLWLIAGPDRVGKTTYCKTLKRPVYHFGPPNPTIKNIYSSYRAALEEQPAEVQICFDRGWVCSYILDTFRRHAGNHAAEITQLEIDLFDQGWEVEHIGITREWSWSAPLHLKELRELYPRYAAWKIRDLFIEKSIIIILKK